MLGGGGGFLDQMNKTLKANREMLRAALKKKSHKAFSKEDLYQPKATGFKERKKFTETQRKDLLKKLAEETSRDNVRRLLIFTISVAILLSLLWLLLYMLRDHFPG